MLEKAIAARRAYFRMKAASMTDAQKEARREYARKWRAENRDKVRAAQERYGLKQAEKMQLLTEQPPQPEEVEYG